MNVCALVATLGVHEGATKYVSSLLGEGKRDEAAATGKFSIRIGVLSGSAVCAMLFLFSCILSRDIFYKPEVGTVLRILSFFIPFNVLSLIIVWILRGHGFIRARLYYIDIGMPLFFLVYLTVSFVLMPYFAGILYAFVFSSFSVFIAATIYGYRKIRLNPFPLKNPTLHTGFMKFSLSTLLLMVMYVIFGCTDTLILGRYASAGDVGIYNIGMLLANLLTFPYMALGFVFMPIAGELLAKGQRTELNRTYQILTKWVFSATLPLFFILFFFPQMVISTLFGGRFLAAVVPLRILSIGFLLQTVMGPSICLLMVMGLSWEIRNIAVLGTLLNITLNYLLVKHFNLSLTGASVATMLSYTLISGINFIILYRTGRFYSITSSYIKPISGSAAVGIALYVTAKMLPLYLWMLPLYLILFIGGYFMVLLLAGSFDVEDVSMLKTLSEKIGLRLPWLWRAIYIFDKRLLP